MAGGDAGTTPKEGDSNMPAIIWTRRWVGIGQGATPDIRFTDELLIVLAQENDPNMGVRARASAIGGPHKA